MAHTRGKNTLSPQKVPHPRDSGHSLAHKWCCSGSRMPSLRHSGDLVVHLVPHLDASCSILWQHVVASMHLTPSSTSTPYTTSCVVLVVRGTQPLGAYLYLPATHSGTFLFLCTTRGNTCYITFQHQLPFDGKIFLFQLLISLCNLA